VSVLTRIAAAALGVATFVVSVLVVQLARGLDDGALVDASGRVIAAVPATGAWAAGLVAFVVALLAALLVRRPSRGSWLLVAGALLVLLLAGTMARLALGADDPETLPHTLPLTWLLAGAASPLTWVLAGLAFALAIRTRRPEPAGR
jgi:hypothetical protein